MIPQKTFFKRNYYRGIGYYSSINGDDGYILPIYEPKTQSTREVRYYSLSDIKHRIDTELL